MLKFLDSENPYTYGKHLFALVFAVLCYSSVQAQTDHPTFAYLNSWLGLP
ncbi:hypothetical protein J2X69_000522 [Algoriphagus sp. 4150]|nr:hypothetical protein [Algoriphagus sp. 4150]MDR7128194.1 hypothetical protein [Algoriphagus sp. 4150]